MRARLFPMLVVALFVGSFLLPVRAEKVTYPANATAADIPFTTIDGVDLALDAYLPETSMPVPAVILIHGGYWQSGDKQSHARLANRMMLWGYAAFAINYRLAPDFPFPAAVEDVQCAVAWVREHAAEYSVDPDRIALAGHIRRWTLGGAGWPGERSNGTAGALATHACE